MGATLQIKDLPSRKWIAIRRKAQQLGTTPERYLRALIDEDLALDRKAQSVSLSELGRPFEKALEGVSDSELDELVDRARHVRRSRARR
jgi:RecB family exonuclease